jgi:ribosomal protein S14
MNRNQLIVEKLYRGTESMASIGREFGLSRERIRQIAVIRHIYKRKARKATVEKPKRTYYMFVICKGCGRVFTVLRSLYRWKRKSKKPYNLGSFCSRECYFKAGGSAWQTACG